MIRICLTLFVLIFFGGCIKDKLDWGKAATFFPEKSLLKKGVVNKYYEHHDFNGGSNSFIIVRYSKFQINEFNDLVETEYDVGFNPSYTRIYKFDSNNQVLVSEHVYNTKDTLITEISSPVLLNWDNEKSIFNITRNLSNNRSTKIEANLLETQDVEVNTKPAKTFKMKVLVDFNEGDESREYSSEITYVEGLGPYSELAALEERVISTELIEQMTIEEFEGRSNHGLERVGYIDPDKLIDPDSFELCDSIEELADYYNSTPKGRYSKYKNGLEKDLLNNIDLSLIEGQQGYLTYRFYVNCHGEAGYFVAEGVDFNYQPKKFSEALLSNIFQSLKQLDQFMPVQIRGANRDAHFYITFRLNNGKITDILP